MVPQVSSCLTSSLSSHKAPISEVEVPFTDFIHIMARFLNTSQTTTSHRAEISQELVDAIEILRKQLAKETHESYQAQKNSSFAKTLKLSAEFLSSVISVTTGLALCSTGVAMGIGAILLGSGSLGCIHATLELTQGYEKIASCLPHKAQQEVVKNYLPLMVSTALVITTMSAGSYGRQVAEQVVSEVITFFMPAILNTLEATQIGSKAYFDFIKNQHEIKKVDIQALTDVLNTALRETLDTLHQTQELQYTHVKLTQAMIETYLHSQTPY